MIATVTLNPSLDEWIQLPSLRVGQLNRASGFVRYPGGKGINVSRVIHELGGKTLAFGFAGGEDGMILRQLMNRLAIPHEFVTVSGSTRNNYKIRTSKPTALTEINAAGPPVSSANLRTLHRVILQRVSRLGCVVFSGSLPPGAPDTLYQRWMRRLQRDAIPSVLDTSGTALRQGLVARPWLIKPNREEAEDLLRRRLRTTRDLVNAVRALLRLGSEIVVLSLGKAGAILGCASLDGVWSAQSPAIRVDSAVGAGDSLIGGLLVGWANGQSLLESFRLGIACGTATAMTPGTELCHRRDVQRLLPRIVIRQIA